MTIDSPCFSIDCWKTQPTFAIIEKKKKNSNGSVRKSYFREYEWNPFIAKMLKDDELWFYRVPAEFWQTLQGHQGYVLIRNGKIVDQVITKRN